jgi:hypothetical protein
MGVGATIGLAFFAIFSAVGLTLLLHDKKNPFCIEIQLLDARCNFVLEDEFQRID